MASNVHEIAFKIAGNISGTFAKAFSSANKTLGSFNNQLVAVNQKAAQIDKIQKMREAVGEAAKSYQEAQQRANELENAISQTQHPTAQMTAEFNKATEAVRKAKDALDKKQEALDKLEDAAETAGQSMQTLALRQKQLKAAADQARIAQDKLTAATERQQKFKGMISAGAMGMATTVAAAAPIVLTVKTAMDFEDMRAELGKYSDEAGEIFKGIEKLTGKYSKSAADMTAMAANAMQSGIAKTKDEVLELVEAQTQAAVAFGMSGDAIGSAWADIQSKMGLTVKQAKAVFDIVNKLGNETSASSEDILQVLQRQGGTLRALTALNEKQVAALAGAFRSASVSSEVAATSMGTFVSRLTVGEKATKAQQEAFEALGLDAETVAKRMTASAESAEAQIQEVFARINKLSPDKRGAIIGQLFGNEAGIKSAVATLAANSQMLGDNLKMVADDANYAGSMFKEYMARANTTSEAVGIFKNQLISVSAQIGQSMLPAVKALTQDFIAVASTIGEFVGKNQGLVTVLLRVISVLLLAKFAFHTMQLTVGLIGTPIMTAVKAYRAYQVALAQANMATATGTALTLKQKAALAIHTIATKAASAAQRIWTAAKNGTWLTTIKETAALVANKVATIASSAASHVAAAAQWVWNTAMGSSIFQLIAQKAALVASKVALLLTEGAVWLVTAAQWAWNVAMTMNPIGLIIMLIGALIAIIVALIAYWDEVVAATVACWEGIKNATVACWNAIVSFLQTCWDLIVAGVLALWDGLVACWEGIKAATVACWNAVIVPIETCWNKLKEFIAFIIGTFQKIFISVFQAIRDAVVAAFRGLVGIVKAPINGIIWLVNKAISGINSIKITFPEWVPKYGGKSLGFNIPHIPKLAKGGIATAPTLAMIGEGKENEAVLPLSKLDDLLSGGSGKGDIIVNFAPVINIHGGSGDAYADVQRGLREGRQTLKKELKKLLKNERRLSYS